ncbi:thiol reductant ABC exporter subunit CydD [Compostimonas suwonensis]|uniref:ATP-binding cassette subfamily C protein CydD n=1 Tax=Compostimonas suwonensis TaxID=1048394 RepID=A0A2M9BZ84_9MICO|nr:thiol reductant ABC exporter subunit CydD [Compostimonas suwonensis]PJJ63380.1 ATP-binding cassette subfamily C protein CydD [Compostimonas suwonensis]
MKPFDPRLLRHASAARSTLALGAMLALVQTASIVGFAWFLSRVIVGVVEGQSLAGLSPLVVALAVVVLVRGLTILLIERVSAEGAARVKSQLRARVLDTIARRGPSWMSTRNSARITTIVGSGLDALDPYFAKYLPQLILTALGTPILVLVLLSQDVASGITVLVTLPLIPIFMILIGWATQAVQRKQWQTLTVLSTRFLDVVGGLSTLTIFGRQRRQVERIRAVTDDYRTQTMSVLRYSFLSGFALELAASLSVALVAVSIGIRLVDGELGLAVGLFVLLLVPEAFLPLRNVGVQYHAATEGVAAADDVLGILGDAPGPAAGDDALDGASGPATHPGRSSALELDRVSVSYEGRPAIADFSARFEPGTISAVVGPSGAGKSSIVSALLGFVEYEGEIRLGGADVAAAPLRGREWLAWSGQRPGLIAASVAQNVTLGDAQPHAETLARALRLAAVDVEPELELGVGGSGVSGGQAQRISIARALYRALRRRCAVLVLDEPSSALDRTTEAVLMRGLREIAREGCAVVVVSHRAALTAEADVVVEVGERAHV